MGEYRPPGRSTAEVLRNTNRTSPRRLAIGLAWVFVLWIGLLGLNRASRRVAGGSMRPTLHPGDVILVLPVRSSRLRRGDVIVARDPRAPAIETVKRVVGLPGEQVTVRGGSLEVAGIPYEEPYVPGEPEPKLLSRPSVTRRVPSGCVFVLGDDRNWSTDSRDYGPLPGELVVGRVAARLCPPRSAPHLAPRPLQ